MPAICSLPAMMRILPGNVSHVSRVTCDVDTCLANYNCRMPSSASGSCRGKTIGGYGDTALGHIALANKGEIWPVQDPGEMHQY